MKKSDKELIVKLKKQRRKFLEAFCGNSKNTNKFINIENKKLQDIEKIISKRIKECQETVEKLSDRLVDFEKDPRGDM